VVVTPPIELVGADETVPVLPTELLVVSLAVVVVPFTVVVVAPLVVVAPEVLVAPLVVVPFTVVVVAPLVVVAPEVLVAPLVVVPFTVVVVAPEVVVVAPEVLVAPPVVVVSLPVVVVVSLAVVVVVPPVVVAEASCPTLTPASTIRATMISQAAGRLDAFLTCLAIDPYLLLFARPPGRAPRIGQTRQPPAPAISGEVGARPKEPRMPGWAAADRSV
jgi:hypothetical protein